MLARGSRGLNVKNLQLNLMKLGYNPGSYNGFFDVKTEEAVMIFQMKNNLPITGIVNQEMQQFILQLVYHKSMINK